MKKNLLNFVIVILCVGALPTFTLAQDAPGTGAGTQASDYLSAPPPSFVSGLKRNNGNGHCEGSGLTTLGIKGTPPRSMQLVDIANKSTKAYLDNFILDGNGVLTSKGFTFCLAYNIPPVNKLIFHFTYPGGEFWIED